MKRVFCLIVFVIAIMVAAQNSHAAILYDNGGPNGPAWNVPQDL